MSRLFCVALFTRRLFGNWLGVAVRYLLIKHGLAGGLVIVRCGGSVHGLSPDLYSFIVLIIIMMGVLVIFIVSVHALTLGTRIFL